MSLKSLKTWACSKPTIRTLLNILEAWRKNNGGLLANALTYGAFVSLFPALILFVTLLDVTLDRYPHFRRTLERSTWSSIPVVGDVVHSSLGSVQGRGIAAVIGAIGLLFGARQISTSLQSALTTIVGKGHAPHRNFFASFGLSVAVLIVIGIATVLAPTALTTGASKHTVVLFVLGWILAIAVNTLALWLVWWLSVPWLGRSRTTKRTALVGGIALTAVQAFGAWFVASQLKHLKPLYGSLAVTLVLLAWLSIEARIVLFTSQAAATISEPHVIPAKAGIQI